MDPFFPEFASKIERFDSQDGASGLAFYKRQALDELLCDDRALALRKNLHWSTKDGVSNASERRHMACLCTAPSDNEAPGLYVSAVWI